MNMIHRLSALMAALVVVSCGLNPRPHPPTPPVPDRAFAVDVPATSGTIAVDGWDCPTHNPDWCGKPLPIQDKGGYGHVDFPALSGTAPAMNLHIKADGYNPLDCVASVPAGDATAAFNVPLEGNRYRPEGCPANLTPVIPPIPDPPTRDQALLMNLTFQGLSVNITRLDAGTGQPMTNLPWFDAALTWLSDADQDAVLAQKKAAGDTHAIIAIPNGEPLYNECCQPYRPENFGPLDWTAGETAIDGRLADLVIKVRRAGLIPFIFPDERMDHSIRVTLLAIDALQHSKYGDITNQVGAFMTGWDGVFYGWEPSGEVIPAWAAQMRAKCPDCRLGIEFNIGHLPLGGGPGDYGPAAKMKDYDVILGEFSGWLNGGTPSGTPEDQVWQILGRMVLPYHWPADQPAGSDSYPAPFYLRDGTARGPYYFCAFEFDEYRWVRGGVTKADVDTERAYFRALGARCTG